MMQLQFALEEICRRKIYYLRLFSQLLCSILLFSFCISQIYSLSSYKSKFEIFDDLTDIYIMRDQTDNIVFGERISNIGFFDKITTFYKYLTSLDGVKLIACDKRFIEITDQSLDGVSYDFEDSSGRKFYPILFASKDFFDVFSFSTSAGRLFTEEDFEKRKELLPVLLGCNYSHKYGIGDTINGAFLVIGLLDSGLFYLDPGKSENVINLSNMIVAPFVMDEKADPTMLSNLTGFGTLITKDDSLLPQIAQKAQKLELFDDIEFISYSEQLQRITKDSVTLIMIELFSLVIILFFCMICLITALINYIDIQKKELAVHLLCGATPFDLLVRLVVPLFLLLAVSWIVSAITIKETATIVASLFFCCVLLLIAAVFPAMRILRRSISEFYRENEND